MPLQINQHHYKILLLSTSGKNALLFRTSLRRLSARHSYTGSKRMPGPAGENGFTSALWSVGKQALILSMPSPGATPQALWQVLPFSSQATFHAEHPSAPLQVAPPDSRLWSTHVWQPKASQAALAISLCSANVSRTFSFSI